MLIRSLPWTDQPQVTTRPTNAPFRVAFSWLGSASSHDVETGSAWTRSASLTDIAAPAGRGVRFTGTTTNAFTRSGISTAAEQRFTALAVFSWNSGAGNNFPQLLGSSTANNGFRLGNQGSGTFGLVKGGVVNLNTVTLTGGVIYVVVASHRTDTGEYYIVVRPYGGGALLRASGTNTSAAAAGNGSAGVGIARTDFAGAWNGDIYAASAGFDWLPESAAYELLDNPWQVFEPRRSLVPALVGGGGITGTLAKTNANDTSAASGTTTVTGSLARTNANDTSAASGTTTVVGALATTNANDTSAASGEVGGGIGGSANYTNANDTSSASGTTTVVGTAAATNANDTSAATGTTTVVGTLAKTNANDTVAASGLVGSITGTVNVTNENDAATASGDAGAAITGRRVRRSKTKFLPPAEETPEDVKPAEKASLVSEEAMYLMVESATAEAGKAIKKARVTAQKKKLEIQSQNVKALDKALMEWF